MHVRFYAPGLAAGDRLVRLPEDEAAHLSRVLRLRAGAEVRVFDGRGTEYAGRVREVRGAHVTVDLGERAAAAPEPRVRLTLVQAVPKGDAMDQIVRDAAMMGVSAIVPLVSGRAEVTIARVNGARRVERWQRIAVASVKQCGRAVVPEVGGPASLPDCLRALADERRYILVEPGISEGPPTGMRGVTSQPAPASAAVIVGPEGGWTDAEVSLAVQAGCTALTLGGRTLRSSAAALIATTALQCLWGDLG